MITEEKLSWSMRYWFPFFWLYCYYFCFVSEITFTFYNIIIPLNPCNRKCRLCRTFSNSFMHCLTVIVECVFIALRLASNFGPQQLSYQMVPARSLFPTQNQKGQVFYLSPAFSTKMILSRTPLYVSHLKLLIYACVGVATVLWTTMKQSFIIIQEIQEF